ncbi:MAG: hypothetical protein KDJ52_04615 [Anaerolineae bacterium]|nr:hypothetical protein [Anaerolineae bacterium]
MTTEREYQNLLDRIAALRETVIDRLGTDLIQNPQLADALTRQIDEMLSVVVEEDMQATPPPDKGLAELVGLGSEAATIFGQTRLPSGVQPYDDTVTSERIIAVGDLYYLFQHEKIGVFHALLKLQELFRAGTVRLSSGDGAYGLYQYDRRQVLRHTQRDRMQAYRRAFGYTKTNPPLGARPNNDFHKLFDHFMTQVAQFFRDKRISEVIRPRATDPSFGSIAVVRRAGLDLRNNLKNASYGHINVLRVEMMQLLDEAFRILNTKDIKKLFGADNAWDVVEEVMKQYLNQPQINASPRNRMAIAGRDVIRWLGQPHILNASRAEFEALLTEIADEAEEWLTSAEALGITRPRLRAPIHRNGRTSDLAKREAEWELELG